MLSLLMCCRWYPMKVYLERGPPVPSSCRPEICIRRRLLSTCAIPSSCRPMRQDVSVTTAYCTSRWLVRGLGAELATNLAGRGGKRWIELSRGGELEMLRLVWYVFDIWRCVRSFRLRPLGWHTVLEQYLESSRSPNNTPILTPAMRQSSILEFGTTEIRPKVP